MKLRSPASKREDGLAAAVRDNMEDSEGKAAPDGCAGEARMRDKLPDTQCTLKPVSPLYSFPCSPFGQKIGATLSFLTLQRACSLVEVISSAHLLLRGVSCLTVHEH